MSELFRLRQIIVERVPPHFTASYDSTQNVHWSSSLCTQRPKEAGTVYIILPDKVVLRNP